MFEDPRWRTLGLREARYITPWDTLRDERQLDAEGAEHREIVHVDAELHFARRLVDRSHGSRRLVAVGDVDRTSTGGSHEQ